MLARVLDAAGKVDVLHVLLEVAAVGGLLAADGATEAPCQLLLYEVAKIQP